VAVLAGPRGEVVIVVDVARGTSKIGVAVGERESRTAVIKLCTKPAIKPVALIAFARGKCCTSTLVRGIGGVLPVLQVARIALGFKPQELSDGSALMAGIARHGSMGSEKRKAILVVLNLLGGDIPAFYGMTLRTVGAHLAAMNIGVTIGAILAHVCEDRLNMTLNAFHFFV